MKSSAGFILGERRVAALGPSLSRGLSEPLLEGLQASVSFEGVLQLGEQEVPGVLELIEKRPVDRQQYASPSRATTLEPVARFSRATRSGLLEWWPAAREAGASARSKNQSAAGFPATTGFDSR